jgi:hypothetical protein
MKPTNKIERLVKQNRYKAGPDAYDKTLYGFMQAVDDYKEQKSTLTKPNILKMIMKMKITKFAAAAAIIVAILIGINYFGGSIDAASVAWADIVTKVEQIPSYVYRFRNSTSSGPKKEGFKFVSEGETIVYNSSEYGIRLGHYNKEGAIFYLRKEGVIVWICPSEKFYMRDPLDASRLLKMLKGPREIIKGFMSTDYNHLGRRVLGDIEVEGIEGYAPNVLFASPCHVPPVGKDFVARLWVDTQTQLPVSLELEYLHKDSTLRERIVMDRFQWDVELSADIFEPNIPADYALWVPPQYEKPKVVNVEEEPLLDLSNIQGLNLLGLENNGPNDFTALVGYAEIWQTRNKIMSTWPDHSEVHDQLYDELVSKLHIDELSNEQLVSTAVALRELFWQKGGCLSETSYPYGYAARMLFETAHGKDPENMIITDELVESIQSIQVTSWYSPDDDPMLTSNDFVINTKFYECCPGLRWAQFEQIKKELADGRELLWEDFVRVNDLAAILGRTKDFENGIEVVEWLVSQTSRGGFWSTYLPQLERMQDYFKKGESCNCAIYSHSPDLFPEAHRYSGRLPSFKGPAKRRRILIPCHELHPNYFGGKRVYE